MVVKIRLARLGRRHQPFYNIVVAQARTARNSKPMEVLGTYDPIPKTPPLGGRKYKDIQLDIDRAQYWLGVGAQPSDPADETEKEEEERRATAGMKKMNLRVEGVERRLKETRADFKMHEQVGLLEPKYRVGKYQEQHQREMEEAKKKLEATGDAGSGGGGAKQPEVKEV
ncbi:MAG: 37S ribosomal protein S16, mitochondrial [Alyxoria varia]|nr:MAG: 37S ribosomal protein S16, mitochondrial [Alyxoria varia]